MKRNSSLLYIALLSFVPAVSSAQTWISAAPAATTYYGGALVNFTNNTANAITLTGAFDLNLSGPGGSTNSYAVYSKASALAGNETDPSVWSLLGATSATSNAQGTFTTIDVGRTLSVGAGETIGLGFFITQPNLGMADNGFIGYTSGANTYTDGNVTISTGIVKGYSDGVNLFQGLTFNPRTWSGRVQYATAAVPEPVTMAGLAAGFLGLVVRRRRR